MADPLYALTFASARELTAEQDVALMMALERIVPDAHDIQVVRKGWHLTDEDAAEVAKASGWAYDGPEGRARLTGNVG